MAIRPMDSCKIVKSKAAVGDAEASPTPTPVCHHVDINIACACHAALLVAFCSPSRTARDASKPAIELEKA